MKFDFVKPIFRLKKRRFTVFIFLLFNFFCFYSVISFDPNAQSWFYYDSSQTIIINAFGWYKTNIASLLFYFFGMSSYVFLFFLFYVSFLFIRNVQFKSEWERCFGFILLICCISFISKIYSIHLFGNAFDGAGLLGNFLFNKFCSTNAQLINVVISNLICISIILITRFCFVSAFVPFKLRTIVLFVQKLIKIIKFTYFILLYPFNLIYKFIYSIISFDSDVDEQLFEKEYGLLIESLQFETKLNVESVVKKSLDDDIDNELNIINQKIDFIENKQHYYSIPNVNEIFSSEHDVHDIKKIVKESENQARILEDKLKCFGIFGSVTSIKNGPVVTLFEYEPKIDSKISKIVSLEDDLAMALEAHSIRIIAPIPGKSVIGFEVANKNRHDVLFSQIIRSEVFRNFKGNLPLILGLDIVGNKIIIDLTKMPHLLIAGSTGSGKSVALNTMIISLLCNLAPNQLKLILIDPKRLEFSIYSDIAHLLFPIINSPQEASKVLYWLTQEMEKRYEIMSKVNTKNISDYKNYCESNNLEPFSFIVVIIDELADLMIVGGKDIEESIIRLAQMARACGIHLIVATQRPSVDVITGLIKINFPSRISFKVASKFDSRVIIDCSGADKLLGKGDMLFLNSQSSHLERIHGAYVSDNDIQKIVDYIKKQEKVNYINLTDLFINNKNEVLETDGELYKDVLNYLKEIDEVSISLLQRKFKIGFNRSARIIEVLESQGYILSTQNSKTRKVIKDQNKF